MSKKLYLLMAAAVLVPVPTQVFAQTSPTDVAASEEDVVTVVGVVTDFEINREEIELTQASDLNDLFRQAPSVTVGGSLGIAQKIYVRGLEDTLLNVTIDGAPQGGTLFHHIGRVSIEPELLEAVEVQSGAGEATSGFGAVGGAIRFKTRNALDLLEDDDSFGGVVKAGYFSNEGYKLSGTAYGRLSDNIGIMGSYVYTDRENFDDGNGDEVLGTSATQQLGFVKIGGEFDNGHNFSVSYERREEEGEFGQRPNWPAMEDDTLFPAEGQRDTAIINYGFDATDVFSVETTGYWTQSTFEQNRFDRWGLYGADIETYGFDLRGRLEKNNHVVVGGIEHRDDKVVSEYLDADQETLEYWAWDANVSRFEENGELTAFYIQNQWQISPTLLLSGGARYDVYNLSLDTYGEHTKSEGLSLNGGAEFALTPNLTLSAGYAEAFRGKEIGDAFTLEKRPGRDRIAPDLSGERVDNIEVGVEYARGGFTASAAYYNMTIDDVIVDQLGRGSFPEDSIYYENIGEFLSKGVEFRAGYSTGPFSIDAFYNSYVSELNGNKIEGYEEIGLGNSIGDNWNVTAGYHPSERISVQASVTQYADLNNIETLFRGVELGWVDSTQFVDKPGYTIADIFAKWQPFETESFQLNGGVYNVFDKYYRAHASVADYSHVPGYEIVAGVPEIGRNIRVTAVYNF